MRIVLDTNILVAAPITDATPPDRLYRAWLKGELELVTSAAQADEVTAAKHIAMVVGAFLIP